MKIQPLFRLLAGYLSADKQNQNLDRIEAALENTLSRDGSSPNAMQDVIDMGGNRIINVGTPADPNDVVRLKDITDIASGELELSADWNDLVNVPAEFPPEDHTHVAADISDFAEAVQDQIGTKIVGGTNISVSYNDTLGETTISASGSLSNAWGDITGKPSTFPPSVHTHTTSEVVGLDAFTLYPNFVADFGGVVNGSAVDNDVALAAAEAASDKIIFIPEGKYLTSKTQAQLHDLTKTYVGPGLLTGIDGYKAQPQLAVYRGIAPVPNTGPSYTNGSGNYGFTEGLGVSTAKVTVINQNSRKNFDRYLQTAGNTAGFPTYYWGPATPYWNRLVVEPGGGWSGFSGATSTPITAGVTTSVGITGGTVGWQAGDVVGFTSAMDGNVSETVTIASVNTGAGTITWSTPLANSYPIGTTVTHGYRTMNMTYFARVEHRGHGDAYGFQARMLCAPPLLDSQTSFEHGGTTGIAGGEITIGANGGYGTGWEGIYQDTGFDGGIIGEVNSYIRTNNAAARNVMWLHNYAKMDGGGLDFTAFGLKRIDGVWRAQVGAHTGLDVTGSTFTVAAVALPLRERIGFDATVTGGNQTNGNGWVATTVNDMYISGEQDGTSKYLYLRGGGTNGIKIRNNGTTEFDGRVLINTSLVINANQPLRLGGVGSNTYIVYDSTFNRISLYKNGALAQEW